MVKIVDCWISNIAFRMLAKATAILSTEDEFMKFLVSKLGNRKDIIFKVIQFDTTASITLMKKKDASSLVPVTADSDSVDLTIIAKCIDITYSLIKGTRSMTDCYNQQGFVALGNTAQSTAIVNIISYAFVALFPKRPYQDVYADKQKFTINRYKLIGKTLFGKVKNEV